MKRSVKTLILILLLCTPAFPCGVTQIVFGIVHTNGRPISNAIVRVAVESDTLTEIQTGPFGLYAAVVGPCPEIYSLSVRHGRFSFVPLQFSSDGSGMPINLNVAADDFQKGFRE